MIKNMVKWTNDFKSSKVSSFNVKIKKETQVSFNGCQGRLRCLKTCQV